MKKYLLIILILSSFKIYSHPHVFIDIGVELIEINRAKITWTFDKVESGNKLYYFDDDGDGTLNRNETNNFFNEGFKKVVESNYFISFKSNGLQQPLKEIENFEVWIHDDNRLSLSFGIDIPILGEDKKISLTHFDKSYYIAFSDPKVTSDNSSLFFTTLSNREVPFYYDPNAGPNDIIDQSKPQIGWLKAYPTELFISSEAILQSFDNYKIPIKERVNQIQRSVYKKLSFYLSSGSRSYLFIAYILFLSFIYGVVHALGPGHRKVVISSYILSRENITYIKSISISLLSALVHSGTGILAILLLKLIFIKIKPIFIDKIIDYTTIFSFASLFVLALTLTVIKLVNIKSKTKKSDSSLGLSMIILTSLLPCPGAITIMLFSLTLNRIALGVVTVLAMSLGIGSTLSIISIITLKSKKIIGVTKNGKLIALNNIMEWLGLSIILLFSIVMLFRVI